MHCVGLCTHTGWEGVGTHTWIEVNTLRWRDTRRGVRSQGKTETKVNRSHFFPFPYFAVNYTLIRVDLYVESFGKIEEVNMV